MRIRLLSAGALAVVLLAPAATAAPWHWGVRAGLNGANFAGEFGDAVQPDLRYGLYAGLVAEVGLTHAFSLHGEVAYSSKGGKSAEHGTDINGNPLGSFEDTWSYDYLEVPLLLRARLKRGHGTKLFAEAGPSFGIALAGHFESGSPLELPSTDLKGVMKSVDSGFALGTGVEFAAGPERLGIEARWTRGFSDLFDLPDNASSINQVWTLALAWMW
jgi:hypothetical protein